MCILLKLNYGKFGVSNLFFKSYRRKTFEGVDRPSPGTGRVNILLYETQIRLINSFLDGQRMRDGQPS